MTCSRAELTRIRHGLPIPAFPEPVCGPPGSGLKPFVYVKDALRVLERQRPHAPYDKYDDVARKRRTNGPDYDPATSFLKGCITRSGGANHHYTGLRKYTAREILKLQTFPIDYKLEFSPSKAIGFAGDAYPPKFAESVLLRIAQTAEAFRHRLIEEDEDTTHLRELLAAKGVIFSRAPSTPTSLWHGRSSASSNPDTQSIYRYLPRLADNDNEPVFMTPAAPRRATQVKRESEPAAYSARQRSSRNDENIIRSHFSQGAKRRRVQEEMKLADSEEAFVDLSSDD
jgi:DNA (cytosine-5)-methyltransferase 1